MTIDFINDERIILRNDLIRIGIPPKESSLIALEAGSSQCIVSKEYLIEMQIDDVKLEKALNLLRAFYIE